MTKEFGQDTVEYGPQSGQQQQSPSYCGGLNYGQQSGQQQLPSTINVWAQSNGQQQPVPDLTPPLPSFQQQQQDVTDQPTQQQQQQQQLLTALPPDAH
ncbi:unnamed protein product [Didymodactylos carnosus]|uniref:Uncharacterized protein n=1 Tax=Didymodactylos carnosus TaxID=1234261 RepID=A0A815Z656_9BILA|nr:unnamed protein product [Didymodactylos carnosus]CAF4447950.1 unnamed protein product [Didymodactylos carnosus]